MNKVLWLMISFILFTTLIAEVVNVDLDINRKFYVEMVYNDNTITRNPLEPFEITFRVYDEKNESVPFFPLNIEILTENANISLNNGTPVRISVDGFTDESGKIRAIITPSNVNEIVAKVTSINNGFHTENYSFNNSIGDLKIAGLQGQDPFLYCYINDTPRMPLLTFKYKGDVVSEPFIYVKLHVYFNRKGRIEQSNGSYNYYEPQFNRYFPINTAWKILPYNNAFTLADIMCLSANTPFDSTNFCGGQFNLKWKLGENGQEHTATFYVFGKNPPIDDIVQEVNTLTQTDPEFVIFRDNNFPWYIWKIYYNESAFLQFETRGTLGSNFILNIKSTPRYGPPAGFGLSQYDFWGNGDTSMQYTNTAVPWHWRYNLRKGLRVLKEKKGISDKLKRKFNETIEKYPDIRRPNDMLVGNVILSMEVSDNKVNYFDAFTIKKYNGGVLLFLEGTGRDTILFLNPRVNLNNPGEYVHKIINTQTTVGQ